MDVSEQQSYDECESEYSDGYDSDDSQTDPTFDVTEEAPSKFSRLSIKEKAKPRLGKEIIEGAEEEIQVVVPEFDEKDQKSYETIQEVIKAGQLMKLKVDQCKVYLRKHGLRLTGNKDTIIQRIREHLDVLDGGGEEKYPASSFVVNCKGDACTGDVVLFEQKVYEMFNIASRSANGPPCGIRLVAGRVVKESYGTAKQQHTFTIEVLWSKGEKPLPPLHQLLIKGRNLYRLKTVRQEWKDETEREKMLSEKHARGSVARSNREARIQERDMRKLLKSDRILKTGDENTQIPSSLPIPLNNTVQPRQLSDRILKTGDKKTQIPSSLLIPLKNTVQPRQLPENNLLSKNFKPKDFGELRICEGKAPARQPLTRINFNLPVATPRMAISEAQIKFKESINLVHKTPYLGRNINQNPIHFGRNINQNPIIRADGCDNNKSSNPLGSPTRRYVYEESRVQNHVYVRGENFIAPRNQVQKMKQPCKFYAKGNCFYGYNCKWLHDGPGNQKLCH